MNDGTETKKGGSVERLWILLILLPRNLSLPYLFIILELFILSLCFRSRCWAPLYLFFHSVNEITTEPELLQEP